MSDKQLVEREEIYLEHYTIRSQTADILLLKDCHCIEYKDKKIYADKNCVLCNGKGYILTGVGHILKNFIELLKKDIF